MMQHEGMRDASTAPPPGPLGLNPFLRRAIVATDGTVTHLIEAFVEPVKIQKLEERPIEPPLADWRELEQGHEVVLRRVLIIGQRTGRVFLHAESLIVLDHLDETLRRELLETDKPIGKLLREYRRETFRELLGHRLEPAGDLARHFGCSREQTLLARVYRIVLAGRPAIQITERFPDNGEGLCAAPEEVEVNGYEQS
jgi:chorismate-pyruvate lyase